MAEPVAVAAAEPVPAPVPEPVAAPEPLPVAVAAAEPAPVAVAEASASIREARPALSPAAVRLAEPVADASPRVAFEGSRRQEPRGRPARRLLLARPDRAGLEPAPSSKYAALRGYTPVSARFDSAKGTVYRLSVKGFDSDRAGKAVCASRCKRSGRACFVRAASGDAPVQFASR